MGGRNQTSGNSKRSPASGRPASGMPAMGARVSGSRGVPRIAPMTPEGAERGRMAFAAMTPAERAERRSYREAQSNAAFETLVELRDDAQHEMTRHAAAVAIMNRVEGTPTARTEHTGADGAPLTIRTISDTPLTDEQWTAQYGSDLGAAAGTAEGSD